MRKHRWIAPAWGMVATAAFGQAASAQAPASPLDGPFPPVAQAGPPAAPQGVSYAANPTYTPVAPDAASPAGFPPGGMRPWPTISPYDHAFDQTYNQDGIWFREMLNHERRYKIDVNFISARFRQPGNVVVGHEEAINTFDEDLGGTAGAGLSPFDIFTIKDAMVFSAQGRFLDNTDGTIAYPNPPGAQSGPLPRPINFAFETEGPNGTDDFVFAEPKAGLLQIVNLSDDPDEDVNDEEDDAGDDEIGDTVLYPVTGQVFGEDAVTLFGGDRGVVGEKRENPASPGFRVVFGVEDEDESGFDWTASWINGQDTVFSRGLDDPTRPRLTNIVFFDAPHLGEGAVEVLDYNVLFRLMHETETAGSDLALYHTPVVDYGWLRVRPLYGARYDYIRETFTFSGKDNGFAFAYDSDGDIFDQGNDTDTSGESVIGASIVPQTLEDPFLFSFLNPYETTVLSRVRSHLYGPQVGFDAQVGGEYLMLTAVTKAGVVANTEKLTLDTAGFGVTEALTGIRPFKSDAKTHTHVSPFFELNTKADINVFPIIPYVNRWNWLKTARLQAGWSTLVVGNLSRPMDNIVWRSNGSGGPYIKDRSRDAWYVQNWNVGIHWAF